MLRSVLAAVRRNVIASLALTLAVLALAGGAYATLRLPAGSVTNRPYVQQPAAQNCATWQPIQRT
jgi:hypothetical protein